MMTVKAVKMHPHLRLPSCQPYSQVFWYAVVVMCGRRRGYIFTASTVYSASSADLSGSMRPKILPVFESLIAAFGRDT